MMTIMAPRDSLVLRTRSLEVGVSLLCSRWSWRRARSSRQQKQGYGIDVHERDLLGCSVLQPNGSGIVGKGHPSHPENRPLLIENRGFVGIRSYNLPSSTPCMNGCSNGSSGFDICLKSDDNQLIGDGSNADRRHLWAPFVSIQPTRAVSTLPIARLQQVRDSFSHGHRIQPTYPDCAHKIGQALQHLSWKACCRARDKTIAAARQERLCGVITS